MTFGGWPVSLAIFIGLLSYYVVPFLIGFCPSLYIIRRVASNKRGRFYIKSDELRLIVSLCIALICGYISFVILGGLLGQLTGSTHFSL